MNKTSSSPFAAFGVPDFGMPDPLANTPMQNDAMLDPFKGGMEFIKNLWGGATAPTVPGLAGFVAPTLDVEELDRKIADLRSVQGWLESNMAMLRATVHALEVQRHTIATLQSFAGMAGTDASSAKASGLPPGWPAASAPAAPVPDDADPEDDAPPDQDAPPEDRAPRARARATAAKKTVPGGNAGRAATSNTDAGATLGSSAANASIANAAAWWTVLQEQFGKVARQAMQATPATGTKSAERLDTRAGPVRSRAKVASKPAPTPSRKTVKKTARVAAPPRSSSPRAKPKK